MTMSAQVAARHLLVSCEEISRLREAERLVRQRVELARSTLAPEMRALRATQIRMDELAFGQRYF